MPEKEIRIKRGCCVNGYWGYPSNENPVEKLSVSELAERYLQQQEGSQITLEDVWPFKYVFVPHDKRYRGVERDNIPGTFTFRYTMPD